MHRAAGRARARPRGPASRKVAFVEPRRRRATATFSIGGRQLDVADYARAAVQGDRPGARATRARRRSRRSARARRSARSSLPADVTERLQRHARPRRAATRRRSRSIYNAEDPIKRALRRVDDQVAARRGQPGALGRELTRGRRRATSTSSSRGGEFSLLGRDVRRPRAASARRRSSTAPMRGAARGRAGARARSSRSRASPASPSTTSTSPKPILASIGSPVRGQADRASTAPRTPLDAFAVAVAVTRLADVRRRCCWPPGCSRSSARSTRSAASCAGSSRRTRAARGEGRCSRRSARSRCACVMLGGLAAVRRARLGARAGVAGGARWPARSRSPRWASRSARWRARCAPRRCWRSCSRCRSPSSRWCPTARSTGGSTTVDRRRLGAVPVQARAAGARRGDRRRARSAARCAPGGAHARVRGARAGWPCAASAEP